MTRLIFDIETDGLLDIMTTIHSLVIKDLDTGRILSCHNQDCRGDHNTIEEGLDCLNKADELIGHNILKFDIPAIQLVYPWFKPKGKITDTLILSRLIWPDVRELDFKNRANLQRKFDYDKMQELFPGKLIGSHGLEAWGRRLGEWKGDYSKEREAELKLSFAEHYQSNYDAALAAASGNKAKLARQIKSGDVILPPEKPTKEEIIKHVWGSWNEPMQTYCEQDVEVTHKFYDRIISKNYSQRAINLEQDFAEVIFLMEKEGFPFDKKAGEDLHRKLEVRKAEIAQELQTYFPPWTIKNSFIPRANNKRLGYAVGVKTFKVREVVFNPGSRDHIADRLMTLRGWKPTEYTEQLIPGTTMKKPKVDESILKELPWPEAALLSEYLMIQKRLGQLAEGVNAWLKLVTPEGRIHHQVVTNGAVTGRCTHNRPNIAQCPSVGAPYGAECRALFTAPAGMKQVGADLSGLELRCLAHYMAKWDDGAYIKELLEGDIHTTNQKAAGLPTRDNAKTFIYGFLYGAGPAKIGSIVGKGPKEGSKLIKQFLDQTPALKELRAAVEKKTKKWYKNYRTKDQIKNPLYKGYLIGLDGRRLPVRHEHAALNTLLQSAGALISKEATVLLYRDLTKRGYTFGEDYALMAHVHDEVQLWAKPEIAEEIGKACVTAFEQAGRNFNFRCPITGEYKIGDNWRDTH